MDADGTRGEGGSGRTGGSQSAADPAGRTPPDPGETPQDGRLPTHIAAALCYPLSFASGIVFLILEPEERSVRFHAVQSILLGIVVLILEIGIWILGKIPPLGWILADPLRALVGFAFALLTMFLMVKAFNREDYQLPYLGARAARFVSPYSD